MEPLLLFCLPVLLLFAIQGSEFSMLSAWLTLAGLILPLLIRPGSLPGLKGGLLWAAVASVSRMALFVDLRADGWNEFSTSQGLLVAVAGLSGALAAARLPAPRWSARSLCLWLLIAAAIAFLYPYLPASPLAVGGFLWLVFLFGAGVNKEQRTTWKSDSELSACLLGIAIGFPVLDGSLMSLPATSSAGFAFIVTAAAIWWPRLSEPGALDLIPPFLVGIVIFYPEASLTLVWPLFSGVGLARLFCREWAPNTVVPAAGFVLGVAIAHAQVSQAKAAYLLALLIAIELTISWRLLHLLRATFSIASDPQGPR